MAKSRKPNSTRKPPIPSESHAEFEVWLKRVMPGLHPIVRWLDAMIHQHIPTLRYAIKWQKAYYGTPELGWVIELATYDLSMNIVYLGGADFDSPPPLGNTDRSRYIKVRSLEEAQAPEIIGWIQQAGQIPGWEFETE